MNIGSCAIINFYLVGKLYGIGCWMKMLKNICYFPFYLIAVFTQSKSFKANYIIGSKALNVMGLHVFRVLLSHAIFRFKLLCLSPLVSKEIYSQYLSQGYLVIENFLAEGDFDKLEGEVREYGGETRQNIQGDTSVYRSFLAGNNIGDNPSVSSLCNNNKLLKILRFTSGKNESPRFHIEQLRHGLGNAKKSDPQKNLHSDTFHPTMKAWLFLDDVSEENGPFNYVVGSHKLTWKRLKWEYRRSIIAKNINDGYSEKGSFRAMQEDLDLLGYGEVKPLKVNKNSLVIANTYGFHCRGAASRKNAKRLAIWVSSRVNPFNPFIGCNFKFLSDLRDVAMLKYQSHLDGKAEKLGRRASWHVVDNARYDE